MSFKRIAAIAGVLFVVLIVLNAVMLGDQPTSEDGVNEIFDYLDSNRDLHKIASYVNHLILIPAVVFFAGLVAWVRKSDREHDEEWGLVVLLGSVALAITAGIGDVVSGALFFRGGAGLDAGAARALYDVQWIAYASGGVAITVIVGAVAVPSLVHKLHPTWYGALSVVVAVLGLLGLVATVVRNNGIVFAVVGFVPMLVWILVTSYLMTRDPEPSGATQAA